MQIREFFDKPNFQSSIESCIESNPMQSVSTNKINAKDADCIRDNEYLELVSREFQLLDDLQGRIQRQELTMAEPVDRIVVHYCAAKTLMRVFHLLGIINTNSDLIKHHLPKLVCQDTESDGRLIAYRLRNQLMHFLFKFRESEQMLINTMEGLTQLSGVISILKDTGRPPEHFEPFNLRQLPIYSHIKPFTDFGSKKEESDEECAIRDLGRYQSELVRLNIYCNERKESEPGFWEDNKIYQAAVEGLLTAIGMRHKNLKNNHPKRYEEVKKRFADAGLTDSRSIGKSRITGTIPEIVRAKFGHMFGEDERQPMAPTILKEVKVALEPVPSSDLLEWFDQIVQLYVPK